LILDQPAIEEPSPMKPLFEPWVSAHVEKALDIIDAPERDLMDDVDLFYPRLDEDIPYVDHAETRNQALQAAMAAFEMKFGKFSDVMVARYQKKKEEKILKKRLKEHERLQILQQQPPPPPPVENFLIGAAGYMEQNAYMRGGAANKMAMAEIDYKKPKVSVYIQDDIFSRCLNPKEYHYLKDRYESEDKEELDEDVYMMQDEDFPIKGEESKSTFDDDYFTCEVRKPLKGEEPYGEEDQDFMKLLTDPTGEANLFEVVNKISKERERKEMLMNIDSPH